MDARSAPQLFSMLIRLVELAQFTANFGPACPAARFPTPIGPKPGAMPPVRVRPNNAEQTERRGQALVIQISSALSRPRSRGRWGAHLKTILS